jgi:lipoprotein NlpI
MAAALTQALATGHESAWIYRRLGEWELKNKDYGKALWAFQQYLRLDTANPPPAPLLQWLHERAKPQRILAP